LSSKPAVDGLERDLKGKALVIHVNIRDQVGQIVARQYGVFVTPTFLVFNASGKEVYRQSGGFPDTARLAAEVLQPR
jgi:hypothetical protein